MPHTHVMPHTHEHPHTHSIAHDHGSDVTSNEIDSHRHEIATRANSTPGTADVLMRGSATGTSSTLLTDIENDTHGHNADLPNYTGNSGAVSEATTGASSATSTGAASVATTQATGTASAQHIPKYVVLNYIMRLV